MTPRSAPAPGPLRVLILLYAIFALSAGGRSGYQIATRFGDAPLAYALSALAAALYLLAAIALARPGRGAARVARAVCAVELAGVLVVGLASLVAPDAFPDATVWSRFGIGYAFVPLVLPMLGLTWLARRGRARAG